MVIPRRTHEMKKIYRELQDGLSVEQDAVQSSMVKDGENMLTNIDRQEPIEPYDRDQFNKWDHMIKKETGEKLVKQHNY